MTALALQNASVTHDNCALLSDVSLSVQSGQVVGLLGPNGAGKTTAVRALLGLQSLTAGQALLDGTNAHDLSAKARARIVSYLPQSRMMTWPIKVRDMVALGRFALRDGFGRANPDDEAAVEVALKDCDLLALSDRSIATLSGGELARVHIARAFVGEAKALIVDEPTNALDPRHTFDMLALLRQRARTGCAVLVILHDLVLAARYCDHIVLLDSGRVIAQGPPREALSAANLAKIYAIEAHWQGEDLHLIGPLVG